MQAMAPVEPIPSGSSQINVGENERFWSAGVGALLTTVGLRRGGLGGLFLATLGGVLVYRGASGYCPINSAIGRDTSGRKTETDVVEINKRITVNKSREEVYQFWRHLENLPQFMHHLESVTQQDERRSHWVAKAGAGKAVAKLLPTVEWDAEIIEEEPNSRLVWRSVPGATVDNSGEVRFVDARGNQGTEVQVTILYRAPEGSIGEAVMKLFNPAFKYMIKEDISRFKELMETGGASANAGSAGSSDGSTYHTSDSNPLSRAHPEGVVL
ncbi:SRPBCC family protein [Spirosoma taeanense]|uniref:SRPBCC family protein n=2 Tax=Spirosoma taeanense TaxID=2735870 RepID=A0A6M5YFW5_9BACT|nr:SRPBCC family protein [Spirosoma taeanense]